MFDFASPAVRPSSRFLSVSAILHFLIATVLLTVHFAPAVLAMPRPGHVILLAPAPELPRVTPLKPRITPIRPVRAEEPALASAPLRVAREFHAPAPALHPIVPRVMLAAIAPAPVDLPRINLPQIELPAIEHAAPRVLKTDNFSDAKTDANPAPARSLSVGSTGGSFGSASSGSAASSERRAITSGGFGDVQVASNATVARPSSSAPASTAVEILFKPRPVYSAEARHLQIEGEVLLEIQFTASGELRIVRIIHGLGHGLDESASDAARQIRFRPAQRASAPIDSTAIVHIQFQLAY